jgi:RNA polymerase sigma-32 factor
VAREVEDAQWEESQNNKLHLAMSELDERSRDIISSRWLAEPKATLHELAAKYGVSAERIRQLEQNAMKKVKGVMLA